MKFDPKEYIQRFFPFLEVQDLAQIIQHTKIIKLNEGDIYIAKGEKEPKSALIVKGLVHAYHILNEEEQKTILFRKEFEFIGSLQYMIEGKPAVEQVEALEKSWLIEADFHVFREMAKKNIRVSRAYNSLVETMLMDAVNRLISFTLENPEERYLKFAEENQDLLQRIPLKYLASYLGVTSFSLSRIRKRISQR